MRAKTLKLITRGTIILAILFCALTFHIAIYPVKSELLKEQALWTLTKPSSYKMVVAEVGAGSYDVTVINGEIHSIETTDNVQQGILSEHGYTIEGIFSFVLQECHRLRWDCWVKYNGKFHTIELFAINSHPVLWIHSFEALD